LMATKKAARIDGLKSESKYNSPKSC